MFYQNHGRLVSDQRHQFSLQVTTSLQRKHANSCVYTHSFFLCNCGSNTVQQRKAALIRSVAVASGRRLRSYAHSLILPFAPTVALKNVAAAEEVHCFSKTSHCHCPPPQTHSSPSRPTHWPACSASHDKISRV